MIKGRSRRRGWWSATNKCRAPHCGDAKSSDVLGKQNQTKALSSLDLIARLPPHQIAPIPITYPRPERYLSAVRIAKLHRTHLLDSAQPVLLSIWRDIIIERDNQST